MRPDPICDFCGDPIPVSHGKYMTCCRKAGCQLARGRKYYHDRKKKQTSSTKQAEKRQAKHREIRCNRCNQVFKSPLVTYEGHTYPLFRTCPACARINSRSLTGDDFGGLVGR